MYINSEKYAKVKNGTSKAIGHSGETKQIEVLNLVKMDVGKELEKDYESMFSSQTTLTENSLEDSDEQVLQEYEDLEILEEQPQEECKVGEMNGLELCRAGWRMGTYEFSSSVPFKVYSTWLKNEFLVNSTKASFHEGTGASDDDVQVILRKMRYMIRDWSKKPSNNVDNKIKELEKEGLGKFTWQSRLKWLAFGDRNSKFYHQVQKRRSKNLIPKVFWRNRWHSNPTQLKKAFFDHFKEAYKRKSSAIDLRLGELSVCRLNIIRSDWLERYFSLEEIEWSLMNLALDKAPGPDGFNVGAIKSLGKL
ncbi:hypothetical protein AgCh_021790 [Apium graveolens]